MEEGEEGEREFPWHSQVDGMGCFCVRCLVILKRECVQTWRRGRGGLEAWRAGAGRLAFRAAGRGSQWKIAKLKVAWLHGCMAASAEVRMRREDRERGPRGLLREG